VTGSAGPSGPTGPSGPDGPTGPTGEPGAAAFPSAQAAFLTATQNFISAGTATIVPLLIPLTSNQVYNIHAQIPYLLDAATTGIRIGMNFPSARRATFTVCLTHSLAVGANAVTGIPFAGAVDFLITSGTAAPRLCQIDGNLVLSAAGNLVFYAAGESAATAKILEGANVIVWNIGVIP
jgi:hypothetical protein